jgi:cation diffusion facilitator family transporter
LEQSDTGKDRSSRLIRLAIVSIVGGILVLAIKYAAYLATGSVSLYSDALESIVNTIAAVGMLFALRLAAHPPDKKHPFGHTKVEYFAAVLEGVLILYAAVEIMRAAYERFGSVAPLEGLDKGIALAAIATAINAGLATVLVKAGKRYRSPALLADGNHLWADVLTTVSVVAGISLAWSTGFWILDPLLAVAVAFHVLWVGLKVVRDSVDGLMDKSLPEEDMRQIRSTIDQNLGEALEVHDLRSRVAGGQPFVEFHLVVPRAMSVADSHDLCDVLEESIRDLMAPVSVLIHVEPEEKAKQEGRVAQIR